jgi:PAS domain S-box-containing protein
MLASLLIIGGVFALMFEVKYFADFSIDIYFGRVIATFVGFFVLALTHFKIGKEHPVFLIHILLLTLISSFVSIILLVPESIYINSQLLSLIIFTSALFLSWDIKHQIIVAIYYNILFALSILLNSENIYFLPSFWAAFLFVIFISLLSVVTAAVNYRLRSQALEKTIEAKNYLNNAQEGIFKILFNGTFLAVNPAFAKILSFTSIDSLTEHLKFYELFVNRADYDKFLELLEKEEKTSFRELAFRNYYKETIYVILNARVVRDKHNKISAVEGSILDVTERVIAEKKIKEYNEELKKLNKSKDKFFSIVAHDLLSPFTSLLGFSEILYEEVDNLTKAEIKEFANDIHSVAVRGHNLLENLLSWARLQSSRMQFVPEPIKLYPIIEDVFVLNRGKADKKGITLKNNIDNNFELVADINMLTTIFRNLVSNAVKFTSSGGKISVNVKENNEYYQFSVEDTGIGISPEDQEKLFRIDIHHTKMGTDNEKGTGLGLILSSEFVGKHQGTIYVESELGKGSKFIFTIKKMKVEK